MNILRKITLGLLISLLAVGSASAALTPAQKAKVTALYAAAVAADLPPPTPTEIMAQLAIASNGVEAVTFTLTSSAGIQAMQTSVRDIIALVPPDQVAAFSQAVSQQVVAQASAADGVNSFRIAQVAQAVANGASTGAVAAAMAAPGATPASVQAAASAASSGVSAGAVAAVASSGKPQLTNPGAVRALTAGVTNGSSTGATAAVATSTVQVAGVTAAAVATASTQGTTAGLVAGATASGGTVTVAQVTTPATTTTVTGDTTVVPPPPTDNVVPTVFTTFTLVLSYGNFAVTVNNQNDLVTVSPVTTPIGTQVNSNGGSVTSLTLPVPDDVTLSITLLANLDAALTAAATTANNGTVVVTVPGGTITVSPSS